MNQSKSIRAEVMEYAHSIKADFKTFGKAQSKAWECIKTKRAMQSKILTIKFRKADGTERIAKATLIAALLPASSTNTKPRNKTSNKITFFDLEKGQFRSFLPHRFLGVVNTQSLLSIIQNSFSLAA